MSVFSTGGVSVLAVLMVFFVVLFWVALYMLPSIIALAKRNNRTKVILFNIFLGWTIVMWIISLVWACKRSVPQAQNTQYPPNVQ